MLTSSQLFIAHALSIGAVELVPEGRLLKNGRTSPYFFNSALFTKGDSLTELAKAYAQIIAPLASNAVLYGPPYKGTILAPIVALTLWEQWKVSSEWASSRKELKGHGEGGIMLGASLKNRNVIVIDDVLTTGATKNEALELVHKEGGKVIAIAIAFDRMETVDESGLSAVQAFIQQHNILVRAASNLEDLIDVLRVSTHSPNTSPEILGEIISYKDRYGVK